jgi:hypothetical protein
LGREFEENGRTEVAILLKFANSIGTMYSCDDLVTLHSEALTDDGAVDELLENGGQYGRRRNGRGKMRRKDKPHLPPQAP